MTPLFMFVIFAYTAIVTCLIALAALIVLIYESYGHGKNLKK